MTPETPEKKNLDNFMRTLVQVIKEKVMFLKVQPGRLLRIWNDRWRDLGVNLPVINKIKFDESRFLADIAYRVEILRSLHEVMLEGFFSIRAITGAIFRTYLASPQISNDFTLEDILPLSFRLSCDFLGTLYQYILIDQPAIPLGLLLIAKFYDRLKFLKLSVKEIHEEMNQDGYSLTYLDTKNILDKMVQFGYFDKEINNENNDEYKYHAIKDFSLSEKGEQTYRRKIVPITGWAVGMWRTLYNIRSLDTPIPFDYPHRDFLVETVSRAATQGFLHATNVMENLANYFSLLLE
ncbi:MAG: hypothetical protein ACTSVU_00485 [Promethearchaeota archaeon]